MGQVIKLLKKKKVKLPEVSNQLLITVNGTLIYDDDEDDYDEEDDEDSGLRESQYNFCNTQEVANMLLDHLKAKKSKKDVVVYSTKPKEYFPELKEGVIAHLIQLTLEDKVSEILYNASWYYSKIKDGKYPIAALFDSDNDDVYWSKADCDEEVYATNDVKKDLKNLGIKTLADSETGVILFKTEEDSNLARLTIKHFQKPYWVFVENEPIRKKADKIRTYLENTIRLESYYDYI